MWYKRTAEGPWPRGDERLVTPTVTTPVNAVRSVQDDRAGGRWISKILLFVAMAIIVPMVMTQLISSGLRSLQRRSQSKQALVKVSGQSISGAQVQGRAVGARVPSGEESGLSDSDDRQDASKPTPLRALRPLSGYVADKGGH